MKRDFFRIIGTNAAIQYISDNRMWQLIWRRSVGALGRLTRSSATAPGHWRICRERPFRDV